MTTKGALPATVSSQEGKHRAQSATVEDEPGWAGWAFYSKDHGIQVTGVIMLYMLCIWNYRGLDFCAYQKGPE